MIRTTAIATLIVAASAGGAAPSAAAPPAAIRSTAQLKAVALQPADGSIQVIFTISGPFHFKSTRTTEPPRITIDLPQMDVSPVMTKREFLSTHAALVRVVISKSAHSTHATLDLGAAGSHTVHAEADRLIVRIEAQTGAVTAPVHPTPLAGSPMSPFGMIVPGIVPELRHTDDEWAERRVRIPWVSLGPSIETYLDPNRQPDAARVSDFRQREPGDGNPASEETSVFLSYDNEYLYAVFVCHDDPGSVRGHLVPREAIAEDDQVALYLDTFHDGRHAYVFASNPFGVQQDGVISDGDDPNFTADMVWRSEGRVTADGFVVLIGIPFKSVRFSAESAQSWRIAVSRTIPRRGESAFWPYITRRVNGFVPQMAALDGIELISPGRNVQFTPYGTFARSQAFDPATLGTSLSESRRGGFDAKVVVKNAVTVDAAVNPDFSEIESDDPLVAVNQRFELFLPEKRPFFMENAALFETPINIFFSRRIADPEVGARVTAREGGWAIGGLLANDRAVPAQESGGWFGQGAAVGVARVQRQFGKRSHIGVLTTERDDALERNHVISADTRMQISPAWSFSGQAVRSDDRDQTNTRQVGAGYSANLSRNGPHFTYSGSYHDIGSTLRVPLGFVPRLDIRTAEQYAAYVWRAGDSGAWSYGPSTSALLDWNHTGEMQDRWATADFGLSHAGHFDARVSHAEGYELFAAIPFYRNTTNVSFSSGALRWLSVWALYSRGTAINYTPPPGVEPSLGPRQGAYASVTLRPLARLRIEQILLHERLDTESGRALTPTATVFSTTIFRWKANLQMTKSLSLRGIVDYNQLDSTPALFAQPSSSHLMGDVLVRYLLHPGTAVYVGFNNRYESLVADQGSPLAGQHAGAPTFPVGQQIFVKASYLFAF